MSRHGAARGEAGRGRTCLPQRLRTTSAAEQRPPGPAHPSPCGRARECTLLAAYPLTDHCQFDTLQIDAGWEGTLPSDQLCRREFITLVGVATRDARAADEVAVDL